MSSTTTSLNKIKMPCQNLGGDIILFLFWVATLIRLLIDLTLPLFLHLFHSHSSLSSHSTLFSPLLFLFPLEFDSFFLSIYVTLLFISYSLSLSLCLSPSFHLFLNSPSLSSISFLLLAPFKYGNAFSN